MSVNGRFLKEIPFSFNTNGPFTGFTDFCERMAGESVNKKCVESLIKAGALDCFGVFRSKLLAVYEKVMEYAV